MGKKNLIAPTGTVTLAGPPVEQSRGLDNNGEEQTSSRLSSATSQPSSILWEVSPAPGYQDQVIEGRETLGAACLRGKTREAFFRYRRTIYYRLFSASILFFYTISVTSSVFALENFGPSVNARCAVLCGALYTYFLVFSIPDFNAVLTRLILDDFNTWFYMLQMAPCVYLLSFQAYYSTGDQSLQATGLSLLTLSGSIAIALSDALPGVTDTKVKAAIAAVGSALGTYIAIRLATYFYLDVYPDLHRTQFTIYKVPIRPWIFAGDCNLVMALYCGLLVPKWMSKLRNTSKGVSRFVTIRWPIQVRQVVDLASVREMAEPPSSEDAGTATLACGPNQKENSLKAKKREQQTSFFFSRQHTARGIKINYPSQRESEPPQIRVHQQHSKGRRGYTLHPTMEPFLLDDSDNLLTLIKTQAVRIGRVWSFIYRPQTKATKRPNRAITSFEVAVAPHHLLPAVLILAASRLLQDIQTTMTLTCISTIVLQAFLVFFHAPISLNWVCLILSSLCNLFLLGKCAPKLLKGLLRDFEVLFLIMCTVQLFYYSGLLTQWGDGSLLVGSISITIVTLVLAQDAILLPAETRRRWIVLSNSSLAVLQVLLAVYLIIHSPERIEKQLAPWLSREDWTLLAAFLGRPPLSSCLDALMNVFIYTVRNCIKAYRHPELLLTWHSSVAYKSIIIQEDRKATTT